MQITYNATSMIPFQPFGLLLFVKRIFLPAFPVHILIVI